MTSTRAAPRLAIRSAASVICAALAALVAAGCRSDDLCPQIPMAPMQLKADPAAAVPLPDNCRLFNNSIDPAYEKTLPPQNYALAEYQLSAATRPAAADIASIRVIPKILPARPSPYTSAKYPLLHRVILRTKDGRYFFTAPFGAAKNSSTVPEKYLSTEALTFNSTNCQCGPDGILRTKPVSPMQVITSGYTVTVGAKDTNVAEVVVIPPAFTGLSSLEFSGNDGADGWNASDGRDGQPGNSGCHGQSSGRRHWAGQSSNGSNGSNGMPGSNGDDGHRGLNGQNAGTIRLAVEPVASPFFERPLQVISINSTTGKSDVVVLSWGTELTIYARGGNGGHGGYGGNGGDGGCGGDGGHGGDGSDGSDGAKGVDGRRGKAGIDATRLTPGGKGGRGSAGGAGKNGTDGGDGGNGGNGGNGGHGGDGGNGGNGGRGAELIVTIQGPDEFVEMVKSSLIFDLRGGDGGCGGEAGSGGQGGPAGNGGPGGAPGRGGEGGPGGRGGPGGPGGRELKWTETIPATPADPQNPDATVTVEHCQPAGPDGDRGPDGPSGRRGKDGQRGRSGRGGDAGANGRDGICGSDGQAGPDGSVQYR